MASVCAGAEVVADTGAAHTDADESTQKALTFPATVRVYLVSIDRARTCWYPLMTV